MKILITGSSGYVGSVLARYFANKKIPVTGIDLCEDPSAVNGRFFTFRRMSVTDAAGIMTVMNETLPTHIIHCAYLMNPLHDEGRERDIDVGGSINILKTAEEVRSVKQLILMSSASAYGAWPDNPLWIDESRELRLRDYRYGIFKKEIENIYGKSVVRSTLRIVILRMCTAAGPSYRKKGGVVSLIAKAPVLPLFGGRELFVQFIHEYDLCRVFGMILADKRISGTFNLAPDSFASIRELAPGRLFVPVPLRLARAAASVLWKMRVSSMMPSAITVSAYGIIVSPAKLMTRLGYRFRYSTRAAFSDAVKKRKTSGTH
jgi:UDP-glucose 4-epimerase